MDPVFLLDRDAWEAKCSADLQLPEKYIFVYYMEGSAHLVDAVQRVQKQTGLLFISANYQRNIGVDEIAGFAGVSKRECFRCFKRQLNSSPNIYLLQFRMNRAAEMVLLTDQKMNQIASSCGFSSATYFSTKFKEIYGMTPKAYREENR